MFLLPPSNRVAHVVSPRRAFLGRSPMPAVSSVDLETDHQLVEKASVA
jgi:hypothetical protein